MKREYKVGDMLKVKSRLFDEYVYCVITEFRTAETVNVLDRKSTRLNSSH